MRGAEQGVVGDRKNRGGSHGQFVLGIDRGFVIEGKAHGRESNDRDGYSLPGRCDLFVVCRSGSAYTPNLRAVAGETHHDIFSSFTDTLSVLLPVQDV